MKKKETKVCEWRYIFPCTNFTAKEVKAALKDKLKFDEGVNFDNLEEGFIENQDYITVVPIQIALDMETRSRVIETMPTCKFIVTGVSEENLDRLLSLGFTVVNMSEYVSEDSTVKSTNPKDILKDHSWAEIKDALDLYGNLKPLLELLGPSKQKILEGTKNGTLKITVE